MKIIKLDQNTPEWLAWRAGKITASNAAAVLGVCKFKTPYGLFNELTGRAPTFEGNAATEAGKAMEPKARALYEIENDFIEMAPACVEHPEYSCLGASLDGLSEDGSLILELKYASEASHNEAKAGQVPAHYIPQCQFQLMCVPEAKKLHYVSFRNEQLVTVEVTPDPEYQKQLTVAALAFLEMVKSDTPPPLTEKDALLIDDDASKIICKELLNLKEDSSKSAKEKSDILKAKIINHYGHPRVRCGNVLISKSVTKAGKDSYRMTVSGAAE